MHPRSFITALILHCYFVLIHKAKIILLIASGFSKARVDQKPLQGSPVSPSAMPG